ncbi:hypothetical protein [Kaistia defluvii]|uniref:Uncharacterized protein n=1 Tax=Kaistia defluvii TaxID=410841 RepID=A0ABV2R558_9HYPH
MTSEASKLSRRHVIKIDSETDHPGGRVHLRLDAITSAEIRDGYAIVSLSKDPSEPLAKGQ